MATSKVSLLLHFIEDKKWYGDFMTFGVTLAMGTMFSVTIFQFIPESLHFLHVQVIIKFNLETRMGEFRPTTSPATVATREPGPDQSSIVIIVLQFALEKQQTNVDFTESTLEGPPPS